MSFVVAGLTQSGFRSTYAYCLSCVVRGLEQNGDDDRCVFLTRGEREEETFHKDTRILKFKAVVASFFTLLEIVIQ